MRKWRAFAGGLASSFAGTCASTEATAATSHNATRIRRITRLSSTRRLSVEARQQPDRVLAFDRAQRAIVEEAKRPDRLGDGAIGAARREVGSEEDLRRTDQLQPRRDRTAIRGAGGVVEELLRFAHEAGRHPIGGVARAAVDAAGEKRRRAAAVRPDEPDVRIACRVAAE